MHPHHRPWPAEIADKLDHIHDHLIHLEKMIGPIMPTLEDLQEKADATLAKVTALADPLTSIKAALDAKDAQIADLKALSDTIDKIIAASDNQALAEGALANTPAAPAA